MFTIMKNISAVCMFISAVWFYYDRTFEPATTFGISIITYLSTFLMRLNSKSKASPLVRLFAQNDAPGEKPVKSDVEDPSDQASPADPAKAETGEHEPTLRSLHQIVSGISKAIQAGGWVNTGRTDSDDEEIKK